MLLIFLWFCIYISSLEIFIILSKLTKLYNSFVVIRNLAWLFSNIYSILFSGNVGSIGTQHAPDFRTPNIAISNSKDLGSIIPIILFETTFLLLK